MVLISILFFSLITQLNAKGLTPFLTKYPPQSLRYISQDGRIVYAQKSPGVLSVINGYSSIDFIVEKSKNDFLVHASKEKIQVLIESISDAHSEYNVLKNHTIYSSKFGTNKFKKIGEGRNAKLHLLDEWASFYDPYKRKLHLINLYTEKELEITLNLKNNSFFYPQVYFINSSILLYTDINEQGYAHLISYNQESKTKSILYKSAQPGTKIEICGTELNFIFGEFPYEGLTRESKIMNLPIKKDTNLAGYETIYTSVDHDIGNMICQKDSIFFIKALKEDEKLKTKETDVFRLDLKNQKTTQLTFEGNINQILDMDQRILTQLRGEIFLIQGENNLTRDALSPDSREELSIEL